MSSRKSDVAPPFQKYLYRSLALHAALFIVLILSPLFSPKSRRIRDDKIEWVSLPKGVTETLGSPVKKTVGLPQTTIEEQKKALESPPPGELKKPEMTYTPPKPPEKKLPPKKSPPKKRGHPKSAIEQALERINKQVASKKADPEAAQVPETQAGGFSFGNTTGVYVSPNDPEYVIYQAKVRQRIMDQWILPLKYAEEGLGLICRIIVHMNAQGEVIEKEWEQPSGNPSFDLSALRAIEKASPLDIPPERLKYEVLNEGFIVEFKPQAVP